jgi:hypothetical protein
VFPCEHWRVHANRRFESDARGLSLETWEFVAQRHEQLYEPPSYFEGFDSLKKYHWSPE